MGSVKRTVAEKLIRVDDKTHRALTELQLERVRKGEKRPSLGEVVAELARKR